MARAIWNKKNYYDYDGVSSGLVNFHDYGHYGGVILCIVRTPENRIENTDEKLGKIKYQNGEVVEIDADYLWHGEDPSQWMPAKELHALRLQLEGDVE
jgi:hypothetical protein